MTLSRQISPSVTAGGVPERPTQRRRGNARAVDGNRGKSACSRTRRCPSDGCARPQRLLCDVVGVGLPDVLVEVLEIALVNRDRVRPAARRQPDRRGVASRPQPPVLACRPLSAPQFQVGRGTPIERRLGAESRLWWYSDPSRSPSPSRRTHAWRPGAVGRPGRVDVLGAKRYLEFFPAPARPAGAGNDGH